MSDLHTEADLGERCVPVGMLNVEGFVVAPNDGIEAKSSLGIGNTKVTVSLKVTG